MSDTRIRLGTVELTIYDGDEERSMSLTPEDILAYWKRWPSSPRKSHKEKETNCEHE